VTSKSTADWLPEMPRLKLQGIANISSQKQMLTTERSTERGLGIYPMSPQAHNLASSPDYFDKSDR
jgi:hypothetical protein